MANNSLVIKVNWLKLGDLAKFNILFPFEVNNNICEWHYAFCQLTCMLMRQNVNKDISKDSPIPRVRVRVRLLTLTFALIAATIGLNTKSKCFPNSHFTTYQQKSLPQVVQGPMEFVQVHAPHQLIPKHCTCGIL